MKKEKAQEIIERIKTQYINYSPNNFNTRVLAHYIHNAIDGDESLYDNEKKPFFFELVTRRQIEDKIRQKNYETSKSNDGIDFSYTFVAYVSANDPAYKNACNRFAENSYCWVTLSDVRDNLFPDKCIEGYTKLSYSVPFDLRDEEYLPTYANIYLSWNEESTVSENELKIEHINYCRLIHERIAKNSISIINNANDSKNSSSIVNNTRDGNNSSTGNNGSGIGSTNGNGNTGSGSSSTSGISGTAKSKIEIKIFKVGSANTIYIEYENGKSILLDCGLDIHNPQNYFQTEDYVLKHIKPTTLIITHWHSDHFSLLSDLYANSNFKKLERIIFPDYGSIPDDANKIFNDLNTIHNVSLIAFTNRTVSYFPGADYPYTSFFIGKGSVPSTSEQHTLYIGENSNPAAEIRINDTGIIAYIECNQTKVIMPADVAYYSWPDNVKNELHNFDMLVVPHHACQAYCLDNITANNNPNREIYISNYNDVFQDWFKNGKQNYHRSYVDHLINDKTTNKHKYTCALNAAKKPYYLYTIQ